MVRTMTEQEKPKVAYAVFGPEEAKTNICPVLTMAFGRLTPCKREDCMMWRTAWDATERCVGWCGMAGVPVYRIG